MGSIRMCLTTEQKFYFMIALVGSFFFVEIVVGYITNSLALLSDAFHMLSDLIALVVGLAAVRISKLKSERNTFGWARAEVLGALVNAVFMLAVCLTIVLESIERFLHVQGINQPVLLLLIGAGGLSINVIAFGLFIGGETEPTHNLQPRRRIPKRRVLAAELLLRDATNENAPLTAAIDDSKKKNAKTVSSRSMNIAAVLRHVIGDAMGSVIVCVVAVLIWKVEAEWVLYLDPLLSLCLVGAMSSSTFPLLNEACQVLMQQSPPEYIKPEFRRKLNTALKEFGVLSYHSFQIWRLSGNKLVASIHIILRDMSEYMEIAQELCQFFHDENVHSITIQPEILKNPLNCHQHEHKTPKKCPIKLELGQVGCCCDVPVTQGITVIGSSTTLSDDHNMTIKSPRRDSKSLLYKLMHAESTSCLFAASVNDRSGEVVHHCHPVISCTPTEKSNS